MNNELPTYSVVIEWENARLSELQRTREMLKALREQIAQSEHPRPETIILHDKEHVGRQLIEDIIGEACKLEAWPADIRIIPTDGLNYYEQKNFGAQQCDTDLITFLDSDVIPERGWLAGLLEAFEDPDVQVVHGNVYIDVQGLYSKAFALFWFFPRRAEGNGLYQTTNYSPANNVTFRRATFEAFKYPSRPTFRGQCGALSQTLRNHGIATYCQPKSHVSHPPPNGLRHFVNRAVCTGHDWVLRRHLNPEKRDPSLATSYIWYRRHLRRAQKRIAVGYREVQLGPVGAVGALGIAAGYYTAAFAGAWLTLVQPRLVHRLFSI